MDTKQKLEVLNSDLSALFAADKETLSAFTTLVKVTNRPGVMSECQKELVATAIAVSIRCDDCVAYHVDKAKKLGAMREELVEILAVAIEMGGGPAVVYAAKALSHFDKLQAS